MNVVEHFLKTKQKIKTNVVLFTTSLYETSRKIGLWFKEYMNIDCNESAVLEYLKNTGHSFNFDDS